MRYLLFLTALALVSTAAAADILIGVAGPMTGKYAAMGEQMRRGAGQAVDDINAAGGILGHRLRLMVGDDACEPKQAVAVANKMVADGVVFVAGHMCSSSSIPASAVYQEEGVVQISPASTNPKLTEAGRTSVFRVCGRDDQQGAVAADAIAKRFPGARIAVIHDKTAYGRGLAAETARRLAGYGARPVLNEGFTPGEKDYSALVSRLKAEAPDVVYAGARFTELGLIVRQAAEQGWTPVFVSGDALAAREFWQIAGSSGEGVLFTFSPDPRRNARARDVVTRLRDGGYEPEAYTLYTYGAVQAWAQAASRTETTRADRVAESLRGAPAETVLGTLRFDGKGDVTAPGYVLYRWSAGTYNPDD